MPRTAPVSQYPTTTRWPQTKKQRNLHNLHILVYSRTVSLHKAPS